MYSLNQAAKATGKVKSTIWKACKDGTISYTKDDHGHFVIDPSELHRIFPISNKETLSNVQISEEETNSNEAFIQLETPEAVENWAKRAQIDFEVTLLRELREGQDMMHERERAALMVQIEDLRKERDYAREERAKLLKMLDDQSQTVRLLTGPKPEQGEAISQKPEQKEVATQKRGLWQWITGKSG